MNLMKPSIAAILVLITGPALSSCTNAVPTPVYSQSSAIDQDVRATHVVGPTTTSPAFTEQDPSPAIAPWHNEELVDRQRAEQTGQLPGD